MKMINLFMIYILFFPVAVFAQKRDSIAMRGVIDTVDVIENRLYNAQDANAGSRVSRISVEVIQANKSRSLAELLSDNSAVYIKSLGQGALATASFRGSSPSQTRVNWNGINITPPMAGTFDFSQIPVFFIDNVDLIHGSGHVKSGTGAIGGSVNLFNQPGWNKKNQYKIFGEYGSYNTYTAGGNLLIGKTKSSYQTRFYHQHSDNDYTYLNKILVPTKPFRERRKEAQYDQFGVMQEAYFKLSPDLTLSTIGWFQWGKRKLPQPLTVNVLDHEQQKETNLRGYVGLDYIKGKHQFFAKAAYLHYRLRYDKWNDGENSVFPPEGNSNKSETYTISGDYHCNPLSGLYLNTTLTYAYDRVDAESYMEIDSSKYYIDGLDSAHYEIPTVAGPSIKNREVFSWQANARWSVFPWLLINGQFMTEWNDGKNVSTYSMGFLSQILQDILTIRGNVSYNYRFPSMNDLYWRPGGNPGLKPEKGYSYDITFTYVPRLEHGFHLNTVVSSYLMTIDDWIIWLPEDGKQWFWTPQNVRNVLSYGCEVFMRGDYKAKDFNLSVTTNYTVSVSKTRKKNHKDDGSYMRQIPYVPKYKWNTRLSVKYKKHFFAYQVSYFDKRFLTTDESYSTPAYTVHNLLAGSSFDIGNIRISPQVRIDNLFDTYYESTKYYPMPLRNCLMSVVFEF